MLLSGTYASMPRSSITSRLCREKKPLSALTCPGSSPHSHCTLSTIGTSNPLSFPADLLRYDQMIVAHRQRRRVAQRESPAVRQKAAVRVGTRKLPHSGLFLPPPNVLADLGAFRAQLFQAVRATGRRVRRNARGIDGYVPQLPQPQRARQLHHLREDVVQHSPMPLAELVQGPKIRLRPSRQIAKRQIFPNALLQPPRTGHPQRVGIQPHLQQQRRMIGRMSFLAIARFQLSQVQLLHRAMHEKAKMPFSQHFSHCGWQQVKLAPGCTPENWPFRAPPLSAV